MNRNLNKRVVVSAILALSLCASSARAGEPTVEENAPAKPLPYVVWTSFGCSRSLHEVGKFADVREACRKAEELQTKSNFVMVLTGGSEWSSAFEVLRHLRGNETPPACDKCSLYFYNSCRVRGWREVTLESPRDVKQVEAKAAEIREAGQAAIVVYHFAAK